MTILWPYYDHIMTTTSLWQHCCARWQDSATAWTTGCGTTPDSVTAASTTSSTTNTTIHKHWSVSVSAIIAGPVCHKHQPGFPKKSSSSFVICHYHYYDHDFESENIPILCLSTTWTPASCRLRMSWCRLGSFQLFHVRGQVRLQPGHHGW